MNTTAPVFFLSHGAPTYALEPGQPGAALKRLGTELDGIQALLVVSAHWQSPGIKVMTTAEPETIHDFGGFDPALNSLRYPAQGQPTLARKASEYLQNAGFDVHEDRSRGLDHGTWVPLLHLRPNADIPVFQVSLPANADTRTAMAMGRTLAPLRREGVAIIGSGSLTHNLYEALGQTPDDADYASAFSAWVRNTLAERQVEELLDYRRLAPAAERSHPSEEHFLPLLVAFAASDGEESLRVIPGEIRYGVLAMESYAWGLTGRTA